MNHDRTYRPVPYAPALRLRDADGSLRQAPRRSAGHAAIHPVQPLKGLPGTRTTDVSYRALAPGGAGIGHRICTGASVSRLTAHYSLLTANSLTFTFSAKEKDTETGYSYFGARYYSSDLSIWLSVDPMSAKYASLSPYVYCANNPVKLVDLNGEDIFPDKSFRGTIYEKVHNYLIKNNDSYSNACKPFVSSKSFNLYLNCNAASIPNGKKGYTYYTYNYREEGNQNIYPGIKYITTNVKSIESFHPDMAEGDISLWHFYIVIHEMGHTGEAFNHKAACNSECHNGFAYLINNQIDIWNDLNNTLGLGLSPSQIKELCMYGSEDSSYFNSYINDLVLANGTSKKQEIEAYHQRIQQLFNENRKIIIPETNQ